MKSSNLATWMAQLTLVVAVAVFIFPIVILISSSFKTSADVFNPSLVPRPFTLETISAAIAPAFLRSLANSIFVSTIVTVVAMLFHSMAGYALARIDFPFRRTVFGLIVATLMIPMSAILVPQFMVTNLLGMANSYWGIIVPQLFNAYGIFLFRQFYMGFPKELEEASEIDGCSVYRRFFTIVLPLSGPMIVPLVIAFFLGSWNNYLWPLVVNKREEFNTVQVYLANMVSGYSVEWNVLLGTALISVLPLFLVFAVMQRQLKEGGATVGIK